MVKEQLFTFTIVANTDQTTQSQIRTTKDNVVLIFLSSYLMQTVQVCVGTWVALKVFLLFLTFIIYFGCSHLLGLYLWIFMFIGRNTQAYGGCLLGCRIPCNPFHRSIQFGSICLLFLREQFQLSCLFIPLIALV